MKKTGKRLFSLFVILSMLICQGLFICYAQENTSPNLKLIDEEHGIYQLVASNRLSTTTDQSLIEVDGEFYIQLEGTLYAQAKRSVFTSSSSLAYLKPEVRQLVRSIFDSVNSNHATLVGGTVEVFTPVNEAELIQSSVFASSFPVTNEQVRYKAVGNEQVIASGDNSFETYASTLLNNIATAVLQGITSSLSPFMGHLSTIASLFPSKYNEVRAYTDWTFGVKLHEEKVVQLSWVYVANSPYLGAQTQFTTINYDSIIATTLRPSVSDNSGYLYYKTPNYDHPEDIARQNFNNTWVEQITSYDIAGVKISSLS